MATIKLTPTETACGVTPAQVEALIPTALVRGDRIYLPVDTPPALAGATARAIAGQPVRFVALSFGMPAYAAVDAQGRDMAINDGRRAGVRA